MRSAAPFLLALALLPAAAAAQQLAPLAGADGRIHEAWREAKLPQQKFPPTRYAIETVDGRPVLRMDADGSYGNLVHELRTDAQGLTLAWRWRVERFAEGADLRRKEGDDNAAKVCVFFDLPLERVPFLERQLLRGAQQDRREPARGHRLLRVGSAGGRRQRGAQHLQPAHALPRAALGRDRPMARGEARRGGRFPQAVRRRIEQRAAGDRRGGGCRCRQHPGPQPRVRGRPGVVAMKQLLLLGGGHAHLQVLRALATEPLPGAEVTLVTPYPRLTYSGMVPGFVAGHYTLDQCSVPLAPMAERAGARLLQAAASAIDTASRTVTLADGRTLPYDVLSLDTGATIDREAIAGAREHGLFVRPIEAFTALWERMRELAESRALCVVVVGGGAAGVELALAMHHRLGERSRISLVTGGGPPVPSHPPAVQERVIRALKRRNVTILEDVCAEITAEHVVLGRGTRVACEAAVLALPAVAPACCATPARRWTSGASWPPARRCRAPRTRRSSPPVTPQRCSMRRGPEAASTRCAPARRWR
ncbi:DUF3047 domain-containing protein [Piscinibacter aquaticus]|uniref:DUF3047 domain-containing protein n=1 Tax=Piscinibacter aquaticus TaxID=392597 RepID=A0A5C6U404_9BURK|nr:DUF3047 domain-containing protein [Piscinibacter aquaticus]